MAAWRFIEPLLFGQVYTNKRAISSHYNADPKLFLSFLDPVFPAYALREVNGVLVVDAFATPEGAEELFAEIVKLLQASSTGVQ